ncbi:hypothetical protein LCGC14_0787690 [marine sediment metagenome]|uniref:Uncharacterized protein n=1 Tax=marine sediment metagenome TaxID=412755 RepID=A0A0F9PTP0_9ZZZZ
MTKGQLDALEKANKIRNEAIKEGGRKIRDKTPEEIIEWLRHDKNYKIMVKLVAGGYRNMTYDSDYKALLSELEAQLAKAKDVCPSEATIPANCGLCTYLKDDRGFDLTIHNWVCLRPTC